MGGKGGADRRGDPVRGSHGVRVGRTDVVDSVTLRDSWTPGVPGSPLDIIHGLVGGAGEGVWDNMLFAWNMYNLKFELKTALF